MSLAYFAVRQQFYKLHVSIFVDVERHEATVTATYAGRVVHNNSLPYSETDTPDKAEAYLRQPVGGYSTLMESLEASYRAQQVSA